MTENPFYIEVDNFDYVIEDDIGHMITMNNEQIYAPVLALDNKSGVCYFLQKHYFFNEDASKIIVVGPNNTILGQNIHEYSYKQSKQLCYQNGIAFGEFDIKHFGRNEQTF